MGFITTLLVLIFIFSFDSKAIDEYVESKMRLPRIPGVAVAIVKDDQIVYLKGYGQADPSGRPMTAQTSLILGSITKSDFYYWVTVVAIVLFVKGLIEIA